MIEKQTIISIPVSDLKGKVSSAFVEGYRLVQIGCTRLSDKVEVNYTFDKDYEFVNYKIELPLENAELESITPIYWAAFTYENEMHDLFGINVKNINIDFKGGFYTTSVKTPFAQPKQSGENNGK